MSLRQLGLNFKNTESDKDFKQLYDRILPGLSSYVYKIVKDRYYVNEIVSTVMSIVYDNVEKYKTKYCISTWIYTIARNETYGHFRRMRKNRHLSFDDMSNTDSYFAGLENKIMFGASAYTLNDHFKHDDAQKDIENTSHRTEKIQNTILGLGSAYKGVLFDKFIGDMTNDEIAEKHNISVAATKVRICRGKKMLRQELIKNGTRNEILEND